ncbi:tRNA dihydrouridine synthase DusB [Bdellovibrionota bacterium FG-1]
MRLGPFEIDHPFILAPMAGITHSPFRRLMRRRESALVVSELVSATGLEYSSKKTFDLLKFDEEERVVGLQIFGEDIGHLVRACQAVEKLGADFIDFNLGCPVPKVVKRGAGSAMCRDPIALGKTLEAMVKSCKLPVTIKIRSGWDAESRNALDVVKAATAAGIAWVAIHGRTRAQGYSGEADWEFIGDIKAKSSIPIIGNGDASTPEVAVRRARDYGVDAVMIGRGALRNPFIFAQASALWRGESYLPPGADDYVRVVDELRALLSEVYSPHGAMIQARKFLAWYSAGFTGCHEFRSRVFATPEPEVLWSEARKFFENGARQRDQLYLQQPFLMGGHG